MQTRYLKLEDYIRTGEISPADEAKIAEAAKVLAEGGLVAFPTETVYGLGGDARRPDVSRRIYEAKGRPSDNPLIVHIADPDGMGPLASYISADCRKMMDACWPGPMTLVVNKTELIPHETTGGLDTVAVRMPVHKVARELIRLSGVPVAAPSANRSGRPSTTTAAHCVEDLDGRVDVILDGGPCDIGVESAIFDVTGDRAVILRPGAVTREMAAKVLGYVPEEDKAVKGPLSAGEKPKAPGMKYRHYAPKAPVLLVLPDAEGFDKIKRIVAAEMAQGKKAEVICSDECAAFLRSNFDNAVRLGTDDHSNSGTDFDGDRNNVLIRTIGSRDDRLSLAHNLFSALRETDADDIDIIVAEGFSEDELGRAIMNRLKKAAGWNTI
ncbi:MAG: L-threonylcarbamoyladenylate synthase [Eubacteriales bacterium]|nr:L-threonylcarbamoyladenylate synthase [Eubacteriales bacterium]